MLDHHQDRELWATEVVARVNQRLEGFFADRLAHARSLSPRAPELVSAVAELTMRGGKRLRPLVIYAGFRATTALVSERDWQAIQSLGAAIELLQSYLLIQDDWMDNDEQRRGGPSTYAAMQQKYSEPGLGANLTVLASDVAIAFALELLHETRFPVGRAREALSIFNHMHLEVLFGQQLDLLAYDDVTLVQHLKTGSYTMRGPMALGAVLADANSEQLQALTHFAKPLGIAFQLRDDVLAMFGNPAITGKPVGHDLREGKQNALIAEARRALSAEDRERLDAVVGERSASAAAVQSVIRMLETSGARARVEATLAERLTEARSALRSATCLTPEGVAMLLQLVERTAIRER